MLKLPEKISIGPRNGVTLETSIRTKERGKASGQSYIGLVFPQGERFAEIDKLYPAPVTPEKEQEREASKWALLKDHLQFAGPEVCAEKLDTYYGSQMMQVFFEGATTGLKYTQKRHPRNTDGTEGKLFWEMEGTFDEAKFVKSVVEHSARSESKTARKLVIKARILEISLMPPEFKIDFVDEFTSLAIELAGLA